MAGGVAIYERCADADSLNSSSRPLIRINAKKTGLVEMNVFSNDICKAETTINGEHVLLVATYLSNGTRTNDKIKFFEHYLLPYSIKLKGLFMFIDELKLYDLPIVLCGDFNVDLRSEEGQRLCQFMRECFSCELSNSIDISTTRNMICIDGVFTRNVCEVRTRAYISYYSHHRPLLTTTIRNGNNETAVYTVNNTPCTSSSSL